MDSVLVALLGCQAIELTLISKHARVSHSLPPSAS